MGQYYKPMSINKMEYVYSHDFGNGLKLMEHSYIGNDFVHVVERLISGGGKWYGDKIVWAGDYADEEPETIVKDENGKETGDNLYHLCKDDKLITPKYIEPFLIGFTTPKYLVNLDKKEYVDMENIPVTYHGVDEDGEFDMRIHPLPLLTCEGNGRGGGDYHPKKGDKKSKSLIGRWARHRIIMTDTKPMGKELKFTLVE